MIKQILVLRVLFFNRGNQMVSNDAEISSKNKKNEILDAYYEVLEQLKKSKEGQTQSRYLEVLEDKKTRTISGI